MTTFCIFKSLRKLYALLTRVASSFQAPLLLAIRLYWGWQFFLTGKGKLLDIPKVAGFFSELGIPLPKLSAILAGSTECFGGLLLLLGIASRVTSIPLIFTMAIAYATAESDKLKALFSEPDKFVSAEPFLFMLAAILVFAFGPGPISVDGLIARKRGAGAGKTGCCAEPIENTL